MSLKAAAGVAGELGLRFSLLGVLPTAVLVTVVSALVASGAPGEAPEWSVLLDRLEELSASDAVVLTAGVLVVGLILQPLQLPLVRLLEGYWGNGPIGRSATRLFVARQRDRRRSLEGEATPGEQVDEASTAALIGAAWRLRHRFPPEAVLLPTALGNVLRAAEHRAGRPYGLDAVVVWPRLYPLLPDAVRASADDLRLQLDLAARFAVVFLLGAAIGVGLLATHGWWLLLPAGSLVLAWICYRASVSAAGAYGVAVEVAFDLAHLDLRAALHLERPADRATERVENAKLVEFFRGVPTELHYESR